MKKRQLKKDIVSLMLGILLLNNAILIDALLNHMNFYIIILINTILTTILFINKVR